MNYTRGAITLTNLLMENNKVLLLGKVVSLPVVSHEVYGEKFYELKLEVKRLSQSFDVLPVIFSERLMLADKIEEGAYLELSGQYRSYNNPNEGKSKLVLMVFAREIKILEEGEPENRNEICLEGFVCKKPNYRQTPFGREISDLLIAVNRAYNKSDYIPCIAWGRNAKYCETFEVGEKIRVYGRVQSREYDKKLENGDVIKKVAYEISVAKLEKIENEDKNQADNENV